MRNKCELCSCSIGSNIPSPDAVEAVHAMQSGSPQYGCEWAINSIDHNYCFWEYAKTLDAPVPDKEICALLGITQAELREIYQSAVKKLKSGMHKKEIADFIETAKETIASRDRKDDTSYLIEGMRGSEVGVSIFEGMDEEVIKKPGRKSKSMPTHLDGKKKDIYFAKNKSKLK